MKQTKKTSKMKQEYEKIILGEEMIIQIMGRYVKNDNLGV